MKNWGLDQIGFTVVPTLIFDMTKAKALYLQNKCLEYLVYEVNISGIKKGFIIIICKSILSIRLAPILQKLPDPKIWVMSICTLVPKNLW